jgi:hypothetical protein
MDFKKYAVVYGLVALLLIAFLFTRFFPKIRITDLTGGKLTTSTSQEQGAIVIIDINQEKKTFSHIVAATPYEALQKVAGQSGLEVSTSQTASGLLITKIGTTVNSAQQSWKYTINNQTATQPPDVAKLQPGDVVEWKFTQ